MTLFKKTLFTAAAGFLCSLPALAQPTVQLPQKYQQMEINAPANIKTLLATQRKTITDQKLQFNVGFTKVSSKTLAQITG